MNTVTGGIILSLLNKALEFLLKYLVELSKSDVQKIKDKVNFYEVQALTNLEKHTKVATYIREFENQHNLSDFAVDFIIRGCLWVLRFSQGKLNLRDEVPRSPINN